jgi:hypothetical protein
LGKDWHIRKRIFDINTAVVDVFRMFLFFETGNCEAKGPTANLLKKR